MNLWDEKATVHMLPTQKAWDSIDDAGRLNGLTLLADGRLLREKGLDRLASDLGIKDATDNISGWSTYKYYRDLGDSHDQIVKTGILAYGRNPWGVEEYKAANIRYEDES